MIRLSPSVKLRCAFGVDWPSCPVGYPVRWFGTGAGWRRLIVIVALRAGSIGLLGVWLGSYGRNFLVTPAGDHKRIRVSIFCACVARSAVAIAASPDVAPAGDAGGGHPDDSGVPQRAAGRWFCPERPAQRGPHMVRVPVGGPRSGCPPPAAGPPGRRPRRVTPTGS